MFHKKKKKVVENDEGRDIKLELDRETELLIRKELAQTNINVQGEEIDSNFQENLRWVVDPIDGTANYFRGLNQCCVSIALMEGDKCLIGIIYDFNAMECYEAIKGHKAKLNDEIISVSKIDSKSKASLTTGFPASESVESSMNFLDDLKGMEKDKDVWKCSLIMRLCCISENVIIMLKKESTYGILLQVFVWLRRQVVKLNFPKLILIDMK